MQTELIESDESEIDIKELFYGIYHYKFMILSFVLLFTLGSAYIAYFKPNIYSATASVKVGLDEEDYAKDVISMAMGKGAVTSGTEKDLIKSRYLTAKALERVDFTHHYFTTRYFKEIEIYTEAPFVVGMTKGFGIVFHLIIVDEEHYRLVVEESKRSDGSVWSYDQVHNYSKEITTDEFALNIVKTKVPKEKEYLFYVDAIRKSFGSVSVSQTSENSTILQITVEDTVAKRAQEFANALAEAYVRQNVENKTREATQRLSFINKQLTNVETNIKKSSEKLEDFRKISKTVNVDNKTEEMLTRLYRYEAKLSDLSIKEEMLRGFSVQIHSNKRIETLSVEGIVEEESSLAKMMKTLQDTIVEKKLLGEDYTRLHPKVIKVNRKIIQIKNIIINTVKNLVKNIEKRKKLLSASIFEQKEILNTLPENERKYGQLERTFKMNEEINSYLLKRKSEAEMIKASTISKNRMLDRALLPSSPVLPKRELIVMIGILLGFIVGIALAFLRMILDTKIKTEQDVMHLVDYPIVGTIPNFIEIEEGWKGKIKVFDSSKSAMAESFRHLRSNLQFMSKKGGSKIILITSSVGQEGKTTISVNLGAIMSLTKKKTIIINLDMRKPTLHEKFDLPNQNVLSELLSERIGLKETIQKTRYENLDILSSGLIPPNPSELIQSDKMYEVLNELKTLYDVIILDTPPVGLVTDAKELMHFVDVNLYVVRANHSRKEYLDILKKLSYKEEIASLGIILNDTKLKKGSYGYYEGYGYYEEKKK